MTSPQRPEVGPRPGIAARFFAPEIRAWQGRAPLAAVFWRSGVLTSGVLMVLYVTTVVQRQLLAEQALLILFGLYSIWILVSIWRCSLAADPFWSLLARLLTVAWAANVALVMLFRELELLLQFAAMLGMMPATGGSGPG